MSDQERFLRLWVQAQPTVAAYIHSCVGDYHEAEDLLQNVSLALHKKFSDYDPTRPFVALALGVARNEILLSRRHSRNLLTYQDPVMDQVLDAYVELAPQLDQRLHALRSCLAKVPDRSAQALRLRYEAGLKPDAIAAELRVKPVAARVLLSRARDWLRQCVEKSLRVAYVTEPHRSVAAPDQRGDPA
ncbi:MAG: sigma-70 family RNA polymerase sigma factor [Planctomycetota bacterium]